MLLNNHFLVLNEGKRTIDTNDAYLSSQELVGPMTPPAERKDFEKDLEQCQESHKKAVSK